MITGKNIEIKNCWAINGHEMVAELKCDCKGLPKGIMLKSKQTDERWTIVSRLIFNHTGDKQKRFENETDSSMFLSFNSVEKLEDSKNEILKKEQEGIFQFRLDPVGHKNKPKAGDRLEIEIK